MRVTGSWNCIRLSVSMAPGRCLDDQQCCSLIFSLSRQNKNNLKSTAERGGYCNDREKGLIVRSTFISCFSLHGIIAFRAGIGRRTHPPNAKPQELPARPQKTEPDGKKKLANCELDWESQKRGKNALLVDKLPDQSRHS